MGNNECKWDNSTEGLTLESAVNKDSFPVNAPMICVENSLPGELIVAVVECFNIVW